MLPRISQDAEVSLIITDYASVQRQMSAPVLFPDGITFDASDTFRIAETGPDTLACLIYTSDMTGTPKGALHGHKMLIGHLSGVEMSHDFLCQPDDCLWISVVWAWIGDLFDVLMPDLEL